MPRPRRRGNFVSTHHLRHHCLSVAGGITATIAFGTIIKGAKSYTGRKKPTPLPLQPIPSETLSSHGMNDTEDSAKVAFKIPSLEGGLAAIDPPVRR